MSSIEAFEAERPRLIRVATRVLGDHAEAEDVVQQAWLRLDRAVNRDEVCLDGLTLRPRPRIRVIVGPQRDHFPDCEVAAFLANEYTVGPSADRMGMRLTGRIIRHGRSFDIASDPNTSRGVKPAVATGRTCASEFGSRTMAERHGASPASTCRMPTSVSMSMTSLIDCIRRSQSTTQTF